VIQTGAQHGMISLDPHLRDLVMQGRLSRDVAMKRSSNPRLFETPTPGMGAPVGGAPGAVRPASGVPGAAPRPAVPEPARKPGLFGK
jgi:hypothetical protein